MFEKIDEYLDSVFIRLPKNEEVKKVQEEMSNHLHQRAEELQIQGHSPEECVQLALADLGEVDDWRMGLIRVYGDDTRTKSLNALAWTALIIGVLSIVGAVMNSFVGVGLGVIGVVLGVIARPAVIRRVAGIGIGLSVVGLFTGVFILLFSYISSVS